MKVLILSPMDRGTLAQNVKDYIINADMDKMSVFSVAMILEGQEKLRKKEYYYRMLAATQAMAIVDLPLVDKELQVVIGPCPQTVEFDEIWCVDQVTLSTQEAFILGIDNLAQIDLPEVYRHFHAQRHFKTVKEAAEYANNLEL